ncbi:unnamed protein product [Linum tenue]|uniref:Uncharacterized protein n=1 Tax=Linum tenue TaxID=586396 RepID=A0AAV0RU26_9ROSI|nr:unnamed protein product [Linum tenue]
MHPQQPEAKVHSSQTEDGDCGTLFWFPHIQCGSVS